MAALGFIGLGLMGRPMVERLRGAGHALAVHDRDPARSAAVAAESSDASFHAPTGGAGSGAARPGSAGTAPAPAAVQAMASAADVAAAADVVCLCVNGIAQVGEVVESIGRAWRPESLVVDFSTCDVTATRALAGRLARDYGVRWVDAPMSGGPPAAASGRLTVMVGGQAGDVARATPVFEALAGNWTHVGPVGCGQVAKVINQMLVLNTFCTVAEALRVAEKSGLDASLVPQALAGGYADSAILRHHWEQMRERRFDPPTGYAWVNLKDLDMAIDLSRALQTPVPMTAQAANVYRALVARGHGELDTLAIYKLYDEPPV